jgi:hypothetical protein
MSADKIYERALREIIRARQQNHSKHIAQEALKEVQKSLHSDSDARYKPPTE